MLSVRSRRTEVITLRWQVKVWSLKQRTIGWGWSGWSHYRRYTSSKCRSRRLFCAFFAAAFHHRPDFAAGCSTTGFNWDDSLDATSQWTRVERLDLERAQQLQQAEQADHFL